MNKKIAVIVFAIFANNFENIQASYVGVYGIDAIIQAIQEIKSMSATDKRDCKGLSNIAISNAGKGSGPHSYLPADDLKDVLRNQPEFGGPANASELVHQNYQQNSGALYSGHYSEMCQMMNDFQALRTQIFK